MMRPLLLTLLAPALALVASMPPGLLGQERDIALERFEQEIRVEEDGALEVTERLAVRFTGSWNGFERDLLDRHRTAEGRSTRLRYTFGEITDAEGAPLEVERARISDGHRLRIWVPGAENAVREVVLRYRVEGAIRFWTEALLERGEAGPDAPDHPFDELYWNATGHGWEMPIAEVRVRVELPPGATGIEGWGYTGGFGSIEQAVQVTRNERVISIATTRSFAPLEGLTISVAWDPGVIARPGTMSRGIARLLAWWPVALPPVAFIAMLRLWRRHGRDPGTGRSIAVQYEPPPELSPAEAGTLIDHKAELHDITSTLVDLAVRGYLRIEELERDGFLARFSRSKEFSFHRVKPRENWDELRPHEQRYLEGLFSTATPTSVKLSELQNRFYKEIGSITDAIYERLVELGFYDRRPDHAAGRWVGAGAGIGVVGIGLAIVAGIARMPWLLPHPATLGVSFGLAGLIVMAFGAYMGVRTEKGSRAREQLEGFREFLERVEEDRFRRMITSPELFERWLPFALAFRVEERWSKAFDSLYREPPDWYRGSVAGASFRASDFAKEMRTISTAAGRSMTASPSSGSSSSGSGGGGFSGGGSGGGGGRGF